MPIQVFADESGYGQEPAFVMAGFRAPAEDWALFADRWAKCVNETPAIVGGFKMRDAASLGGGFYGFTEGMRDEKLRSLARVLINTPVLGELVAIDAVGFDQILKRPNVSPWNQPYALGFLVFILAVGYDLLDRGHKEQFELIFDEQKSVGLKAKRWYPVVREVVEPELREILPADVLFRNDDQFLPLQAADMLAWLVRRSLTREPNPFRWLLEEIAEGIVFSSQVQMMDAERMEGILADSYNRGFQIPPALIEQFRRLLDAE